MNLLEKLSKNRSRQGLYSFLEREFSAIPSGSRVLTVGSGGEINRRLTLFALQTGFNVLSFDVDPARNPDIVGDICTYEFEESSFDVIVICEVLEHVHSPHLAVQTLLRALDVGGKLILSTPFMLPIHEAPRDFYRFTRYGLEFLLREFEEVTIKPRNSYFEAIDVLWMRTVQSTFRRTRVLSFLMAPVVYFLYRPFTLLFTRLAYSDEMTTGYNVTAIKPMTQKVA